MKNIFGDKLEQDRIQLEHNLQHTNLSLHLSYDPSDCSSVDYPRRNPGPSHFQDFTSFDAYHIRDDFEQDSHDHLHSFSYHAAHGEDGINPFSGETMSTGAHHASALTISAGLAARTPRNISINLLAIHKSEMISFSCPICWDGFGRSSNSFAHSLRTLHAAASDYSRL
jgi:hypothetical protein